MKTTINAAATLTEIRAIYMGGAHHKAQSGWPKPKAALHPVRWTTTKGTLGQPAQGTPEGTYTDDVKEGSAKARTERPAARRHTHTQLEGLINTNTRGHEVTREQTRSRSARTVGEGRREDISGYAVYSGIWLRAAGVNPLPCREVLTEYWASARGFAARSSLCSRRSSGPKTPIPNAICYISRQYIYILHIAY
jgi:hypothetical protein